jgi:hypothetical protein
MADKVPLETLVEALDAYRSDPANMHRWANTYRTYKAPTAPQFGSYSGDPSAIAQFDRFTHALQAGASNEITDISGPIGGSGRLVPRTHTPKNPLVLPYEAVRGIGYETAKAIPGVMDMAADALEYLDPSNCKSGVCPPRGSLDSIAQTIRPDESTSPASISNIAAHLEGLSLGAQTEFKPESDDEPNKGNYWWWPMRMRDLDTSRAMGKKLDGQELDVDRDSYYRK